MKPFLIVFFAVFTLVQLAAPGHAAAASSAAFGNDRMTTAEVSTLEIKQERVPLLRRIWPLATLRKASPSRNVAEGGRLDPLAIIALVIGTVSLVGTVYFFGLFTAPVGIILSIISLDRIKRRPEKWRGKRMATWALVMNLFALVVVAVLLWYIINYISG